MLWLHGAGEEMENPQRDVPRSIIRAGLVAVVAYGAIIAVILFYLFIFPAYLILRYKYPNVPRVYKIPGGMVGAWIATLLPLAYAVVASYFILVPTDAAVSSVGRLTYELTQFVPLALIFLLTVVFYIWGHAEKRNQDVVIELDVSAGAGE